MVEHVTRDIRYAVRQMARSPLFTVVGTLSLGVGIAIAVVVFSMVNAAFFKPLPVPNPEQIVHLYTTGGMPVEPYYPSAYPDIQDYARSGLFSGVTAQMEMPLTLSANRRAAQRVRLALVAPNFFQATGIHLAEGRPFSRLGDLPEIVISAHYRNTIFGPDKNVVGEVLSLGGVIPVTIVGVAPPEYRGMEPNQNIAGWVPATVLNFQAYGSDWWKQQLEDRSARRWDVIARLKPGVSREAAQAQLINLSNELAGVYPDAWREENSKRPRQITLLTHRESIIKPDDRAMLMALVTMTALVLIVLLLACVNVAGLLLAKAVARRQEIAVRLTLGASRARLLLQLLTEAVLLSLMGGTVGLLGAIWAMQWLSKKEFLQSLHLTPDWRVFVASGLITFACAIVFGSTPAAQALRVDIKKGLSGHGLLSEKAGVRGRLMALQVCVSCVLIMVAFMASRGIRSRLYTNPGYDVDRLIVARLEWQYQRGLRDTAAYRAYHESAYNYLKSLPGVQRVTMSQQIPLTGRGFWKNVMYFPNGPTKVGYTIVQEDYFETMGIPLLAGRFTGPQDMVPGPYIGVVNRAFVDAYGAAMVGRTIPLNERHNITIVGVVETVTHGLIDGKAAPFLYWARNPAVFRGPGGQYLIARVRPDSLQAVGLEFTRTMRDRFPDRTPPTVTTLTASIEESIRPQRMIANIALGLGAVELMLAAVGLYSLLLYALISRSREVGLRMALGANPYDASYAILREGLVYVAVGGVLGLIACVPTAIYVSKKFIGAKPTDPIPVLLMLAAIGLSTLAAAYVPARRASRVQPMEALRYE